MSAYTIGIDIGTGSTKGIAVDEYGNVLLSHSIPYPTSVDRNLHEQNPLDLINAFTTCIFNITQKLGPPLSVGISSAMHSILFVDTLGVPLTKLIIWADGRAMQQSHDLRNSDTGKTIYFETGTPIHPMSPLCKILWFQCHHPELVDKTFKIIGIKEYIWWLLFGEYEIDYSIASATGLFSIHTRTWSDKALHYAGITKDLVSTPVDTNHSRQLTRSEWITKLGVDTRTNFCIGASDGCLANLGSQSVNPGVAALTIGTSGAIRVATKIPVLNYDTMPFNYLLNADTFIIGGPINNGGNVLKWFIHDILKQDETGFRLLLEDAASVATGSEGLLFLPYLLGERAPLWNPDASGVFMGVRNYHSTIHFVRAFMEGISMAIYQAGKMLDTQVAFSRINVSGGILRSSSWMQILANVFNKEIHQQDVEDASARGAAYLANPSIRPLQTSENIFYPDSKNHSTYKILNEIFESIYLKLQPEMKALRSMANQF